LLTFATASIRPILLKNSKTQSLRIYWIFVARAAAELERIQALASRSASGRRAGSLARETAERS